MARTATATMRWKSGLVFDGGAPDRPAPITVDGNSQVGTSPAELLLFAAATCSAADIVGILEKKRVTLRRFEATAEGTRREEHPRRYLTIHFRFHLEGDGLDETKARQAIDLSIQKYCTVLATLNPDIPVTYDVTIA